MNTSGVHIASIGSYTGYGDYLQACADSGYPAGLVKSVDTAGVLGQAKDVSRQTVTIYRTKIDGDDFPSANWNWTNSDECYTSAEYWMIQCNEKWNAHRGYVDYFELVNEPNMATDTQVAWFIEWVGYCLDFAREMGYQLAIGSFSAGCPPESHMAKMLDMLDWMVSEGGHVLAMHDGPVDNVSTFQSTASTATQANVSLRYRYWRELARQNNTRFPQVVITECYNYAPVNAAYFDDFAWYLTELAKDNTIGVAWYTLGDDAPWPNRAGKPLQRYTDMVTLIDWGSITPEPDIDTETWKQLSVPFASQNNPTSAGLSPNDCGPACEAMVGAYFGDEHTVNEWYAASGAGTSYITIQQLVNAAHNFGYNMTVLTSQNLEALRGMIDENKPPILLVNASFLDHERYTGPHFVVVVAYSTDGTFKVHDPNFWTEGGYVNGGAFVLQTRLEDAWANCHLQGNPDYVALVMTPGYEPPIPPPTKATLRGLHMRADGPLIDSDIECVLEGRIEAAKITTATPPADFDWLTQAGISPANILMRLFADFSNRVVSPYEFAEWMHGPLEWFYQRGGIYVEVHNEPNLPQEGLGSSWADAGSWADWLVLACNELRRFHPMLKYGWPGLSPQSDLSAWYSALESVLWAVDWIGAHSYWQEAGQMADANHGAHWTHYIQFGKPVILTEFANVNPATPKSTKGAQYRQYYAALPGDIMPMAFCFLSSASSGFTDQTWAEVDGTLSEIPMIVGEA